MSISKTRYGTSYENPVGMPEEEYYKLMYEFVDLAKVKGLTARQAQKLFIDCADMFLDVKPSNHSNNNTDSLKSISESLNKIASKGIDTFNCCSSTNPY